jgi:hypothetical protein
MLFSTNSNPLVHPPVHFPPEPHQSRHLAYMQGLSREMRTVLDGSRLLRSLVLLPLTSRLSLVTPRVIFSVVAYWAARLWSCLPIDLSWRLSKLPFLLIVGGSGSEGWSHGIARPMNSYVLYVCLLPFGSEPFFIPPAVQECKG